MSGGIADHFSLRGGTFHVFDCTEVFRLVVPKNGLQDLCHTKFSTHEAIIEQIQTHWYTWFSNPLSVPQGCGVGECGGI